jgi:hypothetical protein
MLILTPLPAAPFAAAYAPIKTRLLMKQGAAILLKLVKLLIGTYYRSKTSKRYILPVNRYILLVISV